MALTEAALTTGRSNEKSAITVLASGSVTGFHVWKTERLSSLARCESMRFIQTVTDAASASGCVTMLSGDQSQACGGIS